MNRKIALITLVPLFLFMIGCASSEVSLTSDEVTSIVAKACSGPANADAANAFAGLLSKASGVTAGDTQANATRVCQVAVFDSKDDAEAYFNTLGGGPGGKTYKSIKADKVNVSFGDVWRYVYILRGNLVAISATTFDHEAEMPDEASRLWGQIEEALK